MSPDLKELLRTGAPHPQRQLDVDEIERGARRQKVRSRGALAAGVASLVLVGAFVTPRLDLTPSDPSDVSGNGDGSDVTATPLGHNFGTHIIPSDGYVWIESYGDFTAIDPEKNTVELQIEGGPADPADSIAVGEGGLWVSDWTGDMGPGGGAPPTGEVKRLGISAIDGLRPEKFRRNVETVYDSGQNEAPEDVAIGFGSAWVVERLGDRLLRFATDGTYLGTVRVGHSPADVATGLGHVWVIHTTTDRSHHGEGDATLMKLDPETGARVGDAVPAGECPHSVEVGEGRIWVLDYCSHEVVAFDPEDMDRLGTIPLPKAVDELAVGDGYVWTAHSDGQILGGGTATLLRSNVTSYETVDEPISISSSWPDSSIEYLHGSLWATSPSGELLRLDVEAG